MRVFVLGAGTSKGVGYPLGSELLREIDGYVRNHRDMINRFDYDRDWLVLCNWLESNSDPLIARTYRSGQLEHLFTLLDLTAMLSIEGLAEVWQAGKRGQAEGTSAAAALQGFDNATGDYQRHRRVLLWALEHYFEYKHHSDFRAEKSPQWETLVSFGRKLRPHDIVITFNYDATIERVLWEQRKWSPRDGYGFDLVFEAPSLSGVAAASVDLGQSPVTILHLHGATGWYSKPIFRDGYIPTGVGAAPREDWSPAPFETPISLDPMFLQDLGVPAVDASLPRRPSNDAQILIHPSFLKNYETEAHGGRTEAFTDLWKRAAQVLRDAEQVYIIGYSLPAADSAALTLLLTNCDRGRVDIVNQDHAANDRLRSLLSSNWFGVPQSFEEWLATVPDCTPTHA